MTVKISFDPAKRLKNLQERGLDFADAALVFAGETRQIIDTRRDYGEIRYISAGWLDGRRVIVVWTSRPPTRRVISMRYAHDDDKAFWGSSAKGE